MTEKKKSAAWFPPEWDVADAKALQRLADGTAEPHQQKRALEWIINRACGTYDLSYRPGGEEGRRDTDFAEGRRFPGLQIVKLLKTDLSKLKEAKKQD